MAKKKSPSNEKNGLESQLPLFEAELKSTEYLWLNEQSIKALLDDNLREVKSLSDIKNLIQVEERSDMRTVYTGDMEMNGFWKLSNQLDNNKIYTDKNGWYGNRKFRLRIYDKVINKNPFVAFDIWGISIDEDKIYIYL